MKFTSFMQQFTVTEKIKQKDYGRFIIEPLENGYGSTLGTSLRRVLLTSLKGAAITQVRISGVKHQFSTLKGLREDIVDFILNLKRVEVSYKGDKPVKLELSVTGPKEVRASDIVCPAEVKIANSELVIASLSRGAKLDVDIQVETGVGYSPAEDRKTSIIGTIPVDASFSPVIRVNPIVEETRVGRITNYDRLILDIWTDGTLSPDGALTQAADILVSYFRQIVSPAAPKEEKQEAPTLSVQVAKLSVEEIGIPTRIANALIKAGYETVENLIKADVASLVKVRNLGAKSIKIISAALAEKGVRLKIKEE